jgi:hypothetical protein
VFLFKQRCDYHIEQEDDQDVENKVGAVVPGRAHPPDGPLQCKGDIGGRSIVAGRFLDGIFRKKKLRDVAQLFQKRVVYDYIGVIPDETVVRVVA